jgi:hypothetical protein
MFFPILPLAMSSVVALAAGAPNAIKPDPDAALAQRISKDANPGIGFRGSPAALASVASYARSQGWRVEDNPKWLVLIFFGNRPSEPSVLKFLQLLRTKNFGDLVSTGIGLAGPTYVAPAPPPAPPQPKPIKAGN